MSIIEAPRIDARPTTGTAATTTGDLTSRVAGFGALGFVATVIVQNILRGSAAPTPGTDLDEVLVHFGDHRGMTVTLLCTFVVALASLVAFLGGTMKRVLASDRRGWAVLGAVGAASIIAMFAVVVATEQALTVVATGSQPSLAAIEALWSLHNSVFTVNLLFIGIAMVGLSRAGIAVGITPRPFGWLAPVGATLLAVGTAAGPFIANGEAMPLFGISTLGFIVWLAFLTTTGLRLIRSDAA